MATNYYLKEVFEEFFKYLIFHAATKVFFDPMNGPLIAAIFNGVTFIMIGFGLYFFFEHHIIHLLKITDI